MKKLFILLSFILFISGVAIARTIVVGKWNINSMGAYYLEGNVGIGTDTPAYKLDVNGTLNTTGFRMPTGAVAGYVLTSDASGVGTWQAAGGGGGGLPSGTSGQTLRHDGTSWVANSLLYNNGSQVGIGTTSPYPTAILHIIPSFADEGYGGFIIGNTSGTNLRMGITENYSWIQSHGSNPLYINRLKNNVIMLVSSGNLGIGTLTPTQKVEVNGGIRLNTTAEKPTCNSNTRGTLWFTQGAAGMKDTLEVCAKDETDAYAWRTLY